MNSSKFHEAAIWRGVLVSLIMVICSCNKESAPGFIRSTGEETTEIRNLSAFNRLWIQDEFDVELVYDSVFKVEVTHGKNLISRIKTEITNGELKLENGNQFNWVRKLGQRIKIRLHCHDLKGVEIVGDGTLFSKDTFYADKIDFEHAGTNEINLILKSDWATFRCSNVGNIILKGECAILSGTVEETSFFDGRDFVAQDGYFYHFSLSDSYINATKVYGLNLFGKGNLYYLQEPIRIFNKEEKGSGRVLKY